MSTYQVIANQVGIRAIERNDKQIVTSVRIFPTQLAARQWVLEQVDAAVMAEKAMSRERILCIRSLGPEASTAYS